MRSCFSQMTSFEGINKGYTTKNGLGGLHDMELDFVLSILFRRHHHLQHWNTLKTNISPYPRCMFEDDFSFPVQRGFFWLYFPGFGYVKTSRLNTPRQGRRGVWAAIPPWDPTRWELVVGSNDTNHAFKGQLKESILKSPKMQFFYEKNIYHLGIDV